VRTGRGVRGVLFANWTGGYTVPSRGLYPHQWSWDSAFIAIGLRHLSARRAQRELESLFGAQWADGRVPHIVFDPAAPLDAYFPGPDFWRSGAVAGTPAVATSALIQPPVHALAAWLVFLAAPAEARRRGFLSRLYPRLVAWHRYLTRQRAVPGFDGLVAIVHPWESGMDNSPSWDEPLSRVQPMPADAFRRRDLVHAPAAERPTDVDYGRYVRLATDYRSAGYVDTGAFAFAVLDPLTNALLAASELSLAEIAAEVGADPAPHRAAAARVGAALGSLFDPAEGLFYPRDLHTGRLIQHRTVAGLVPLILPDLPEAGALLKTALGEHFRLGAAPLVPSYDLTGPAFEAARYWRGPGWFNTTWLIWRGLLAHDELDHAERLRRGMLESVRRTGCREYVDAVTGAGCGADDFSWTAALALDLRSAAP
jgi:hypothetical protein